MRIVIAGGGTGGHLFTSLAIATALRESLPEAEIIFIGVGKELEKRSLAQAGVSSYWIKIEPLEDKNYLQKVLALKGILSSLFQAFRFLHQIKPSVLVGTGGYTSGPVLLMGKFISLPILIIEQNVQPGLTNRVLSYFADTICVAFPETRFAFPFSFARKKWTGNPIRASLLRDFPLEEVRKLGLDWKRQTILAFGGSQGAKRLNQIFVQTVTLLDTLFPNLQVIHITGRRDYSEISASYKLKNIRVRVFPFLDHIEYAYKISELIISRSGATTIAELTAFGCPAILIPYPAAARAHQLRNAQVLARAGAARLLEERDLTPQKLAQEIISLLRSPDQLAAMAKRSRQLGRRNATKCVVNEIMNLLKLRHAKN
jgi:UDP-N-acetylglucosamine--N-acetylmuramyl-(pentapeptide) pyrophosphoryl-undecaprenol N-acetylglucosamine transferase